MAVRSLHCNDFQNNGSCMPLAVQPPVMSCLSAACGLMTDAQADRPCRTPCLVVGGD